MKIKKFEVAGAGEIIISEDAHAWTGGAYGFHFGASWDSTKGKAGGVLGITQARKLAEHILSVCNEQTKPEEQLIAEAQIRFNNHR